MFPLMIYIGLWRMGYRPWRTTHIQLRQGVNGCVMVIDWLGKTRTTKGE